MYFDYITAATPLNIAYRINWRSQSPQLPYTPDEFLMPIHSFHYPGITFSTYNSYQVIPIRNNICFSKLIFVVLTNFSEYR
jgi:hypothetical protein